MHNPSRRAIIVGASAGAAALVGTSPTAIAATHGAVGPVPSPALLTWRIARKTYFDAFAASREYVKNWFWVRNFEANPVGSRKRRREHDRELNNLVGLLIADPECAKLEKANRENERALDASIAAIPQPPVRSWQDVAELAEMVRGEQRWNPGDRDEDDDNAPRPIVIALFDAIAMMAKGGAHG